ncbi:MAG: hypothetical protein IBJ03_11095 [Gemmatimonadaceae bacterium]|nr:hypothetical protein [Gemmatimonadaceae bacterium]
MAHATAKDLLRETAERLPEGASVEDALERLVFLSKIEQGRADAESGRVITDEQLKHRLGL